MTIAMLSLVPLILGDSGVFGVLGGLSVGLVWFASGMLGTTDVLVPGVHAH